MKIFKTISIFIFFSFLIVSACKKDDSCEGCTVQHSCVNGACICPEGKYEIGRSCRKLQEGELIGNPEGEGCEFCEMEFMTIMAEPGSLVIHSDDGASAGGGGLEYFEQPTGDSIAFNFLPFFDAGPVCIVDEDLILYSARGKYTPAKDSLDMWLFFSKQGERGFIDSCFYSFHQ